MDRGFTELIAKDVRTRSELEYLRGAGSRDIHAKMPSLTILTGRTVSSFELRLRPGYNDGMIYLGLAVRSNGTGRVTKTVTLSDYYSSREFAQIPEIIGYLSRSRWLEA